MALQNIVQAEGQALIIGLSTDTKPVSPSTGMMFIESDTGNIFIASGSAWHLPTDVKTIKSLSDFPAPVGGVITLEDNTTYRIFGTVDIGTNTIVTGVKNTFIGLDRVNSKLTSSTTGVMFTMDSTTVVKSNILFSNLTIGCPNGTLFNILSSTANHAVGMTDLTISATATLGTINNVSTWAMTNIVVRNCATTAGYTITGANGTVKCRLGVFSNNVGTLFNFGTSTQTVIDFNNNQIDCSASQTFINGTTAGANVTVLGKLNDNTFTGAGTYVDTITPTDTKWQFSDNVPTTLNTVNIASQPVVLTAAGKYPALDGSLITNLPAASWGGITGVLSAQTDLNTALGLKAPLISPTLVTPILGVATVTSINGNTWTAGTGTLTIGAGKTLTNSNTLILTATDGSTLAIGAGGTLGSNAYTSTAFAPIASPTFTGTVSGITSSMVGLGNVTNESKATMFASPTFTGTAVLGVSPTMTTPAITTGFKIGGGAANGSFVRGDGTNFVSSTLTIPNAGTTGDIFVATGTNSMGAVAVQATANKVLMSGASTVPTWSTPTFPNTSATARKIIVSDGTNWVASTELHPVATTSGNMMVANGTDWVSTTTRSNWSSLVVSGSNFTTTSTSLVDITGLVTPTLSVATLYEFECVLYVNSSSAAGMAVGVQQSGTGSGQIGVWTGTSTLLAATGLAIGSNVLNTAGATCVTITGDGQITFKGFVKTGSSGSPTISMKALKTTSGTATVYTGSVLRYRVAN